MADGKYDRQWAVAGLDKQHRDLLEQSTILVIGAGGLGHPVVAYLAGAGVSKITIVDPDVVQLSNLPRQIFFGHGDLGSPKVNILSDKINYSQSRKIVYPIQAVFNRENAQELIGDHQIVIDCSDSLQLKYLLSEQCKVFNKPLVIGAVDQWQGQVLAIPDGLSATYADFFPLQSNTCEWGTCETNGVMGPVVGVIASLMANEAIKIILGLKDIRKNRMIIFDGRNGECFYIRHDDTTLIKTNYTEQTFGLHSMKSISHTDMRKWRDEGKKFQLIDVREPYEFEEINLGGELIPMNSVPDNIESFSRELPVVVHCKAGSRSAHVIRFLEEQYGFTNLYNLEGGVLAIS